MYIYNYIYIYNISYIYRIPSVYKIYKNKSVGQSDPLMFIMLIINGCIWSMYGIIVNDRVLTFTNSIGIITGIIYNLIFYEYSPNKKQISKYFQFTFIFVTILFIIGYTFDPDKIQNSLGTLGSLTAILLMSSPLSNMKRVYNDKNSIHLPIYTVIANFINALSWLLYGIIIKNIFVWLTNALGLIAAIIQVCLLFIFPRNNINIKNEPSIDEVQQLL